MVPARRSCVPLVASDQRSMGPPSTCLKLDFASPHSATSENAVSRLGCTVSAKFSAKFAEEVSWQKVDANGNDVAEPGEDITQGNDGPTGDDNTGGGGNSGGDNGGQGLE